jgi:hypothetical protein
MSTLADLIRAHESNPRALYAPEKSDLVSTPGHYEQTGSQRSPALDRRLEKLAARGLGDDLGVPPDDLDDMDDLEDLNDWLNDDWPQTPDPENPEIPDPEEPELPDPEDPETPELPVDPLPPVPTGLQAYALHSGSISMSEDGGATWAHYTGSPTGPIGFSVSTQGFFVATATSVHYSADLLSWRELALPSENLQVAGFQNGSFEAGLSGWETISGDDPRTGYVAHVIPSDGASYLRRDWVYFTAGEFELAQEVTLKPDEIAALSGGGILEFSGDVFGDGGEAELRIEYFSPASLRFDGSMRFAGDLDDSDPLDEIQVSGSGLPTTATWTKLAFDHRVARTIGNPGTTIAEARFFFRAWVRVGGTTHVYSHPQVAQYNIPIASANIRDGEFRKAFSVSLTSTTGPGAINIQVPAGWKYQIDARANPTGAGGYTASEGGFEGAAITVGYGAGWLVLAQNSAAEYTWHRIAAVSASLPSGIAQIRCVIKATGSPADVYIDNCRLEIVRGAGDLEVTAIGGDYVAANGALYKMSPEGLTFDRPLDFDPTGISDDGGLVAWGGGSIYLGGEGATYSLPQSIIRAFGDPTGAILFMSGGEAWRRRDDPDYPGWDTLGAPGVVADAEQIDGAWVVIGADPSGEAGFVKSSANLATWRTASPRSYGCDRLFGGSMKVFAYKKGGARLFWFDSAGWHIAGDLPAGILDISA